MHLILALGPVEGRKNSSTNLSLDTKTALYYAVREKKKLTVIIWKADNVSNKTMALTNRFWKLNNIMKARYYAALDKVIPIRNEPRLCVCVGGSSCFQERIRAKLVLCVFFFNILDLQS